MEINTFQKTAFAAGLVMIAISLLLAVVLPASPIGLILLIVGLCGVVVTAITLLRR